MSLDSQALLSLQSSQLQVDTQNQAKYQALAKTSAASARGQSTDHIAKLGLDFETMCLSNLIKPMFEGLKSDGPFGGGQGEEMMKSFYIDAIAKQMAKHGGVGISAMMQKQLLKLQEAG